MSANRVSTVLMGVQQSTVQQTAQQSAQLELLMVSVFNIPLYTTEQVCTQCLTGLNFFVLVAQESIFNNQISVHNNSAFDSPSSQITQH